jgi:predicted metal-dependent hydrolase
VATRKKTKSPMSAEHKAALASGREQGRTVRNYLEALESHKPKRGRKRSTEAIEKRLATIEDEMSSADPLRRLQLAQERLDLQDQLTHATVESNLDELEQQFIQVAAEYAQRKGITYTAFREIGVPAATLRAAGIGRSRSSA